MRNERFLEGLAICALVAATMIPFAASKAHDGKHKFDQKWSEELETRIMHQVKAGLAKGAIGMEKGAEKMMRGADRMDSYANRIESDPEFREREAARKNQWNGNKLTAQDLLEKVSEFRQGAEEMREGAEEMRKAAGKMRRGET